MNDPASTDTSCAQVLKVLADETRLSVIQGLFKGPLGVSELHESLGVEPTLLSHHLRVLREADLVTSERQGKHVTYALSESVRGKRRGQNIDLGCCVIRFDSR
ncbi:MAG: metalloregulator ArsR/SmtB family transcription factor [Planctomycetota bacterium]